jgi:phosphate butyryltransferase
MKNLNDLITIAQSRNKKKKIVVASAEDEFSLKAISELYGLGLLTPIFVGDKEKISEIIGRKQLDLPTDEIYHANDEFESARLSVEIIRTGNADIIMKGLLPTKIFIKAILNKETGITAEGSLSHMGLFESPFYPKLFGLTDAAINITPDIRIKKNIIQNAVKTFHALGVSYPNVALLAPIEKINPKMQATVDAAKLVEMHNEEPIAVCLLEGPLALDVAISEFAARHKCIDSKMAGFIDILVVPEITVGNVFYKSLTYLGGAIAAGILIGAKAPVVLSSRTDSEVNKLYSIALAYNLSNT